MSPQEIMDARIKAQRAVARLVSLLAKSGDPLAYREAKVAERALDWIASRDIRASMIKMSGS